MFHDQTGLELKEGGCEKLYGGYSGSNYRADCEDNVSVLVKVCKTLSGPQFFALHVS